MPDAMQLRVVILDGDTAVALGIADLLRTYDIEVEIAADAESAERLVEETAPSIAIIDIYDRPGSGRRLVHDLRGRFPELPILLTSPSRPDSLELISLNSARTAFLGKPFTGETLLEAIKRMV